MNIEPGSVYDTITRFSPILENPLEVHAPSPTARLDVELLLAAVLKLSRSNLILSHNYILLPREREQFMGLFKRRAKGEPVAYILGKKDFWDMELQVSSETLIPRPETEILVEVAVKTVVEEILGMGYGKDIVLCDAGTGSGAVALALAYEFPQVTVVGVDKSGSALACAAANAVKRKATNVHWVESDWLLPFEGQQRFRIVMANPPYIAEGDPHLQAPEMGFEPREALVSDDSGYADLFKIIDQATWVLQRPGWLMLEHGSGQAEEVRGRMQQVGFEESHTFQDLAGLDRVTIGKIVGVV